MKDKIKVISEFLGQLGIQEPEHILDGSAKNLVQHLFDNGYIVVRSQQQHNLKPPSASMGAKLS